MEKGVSRFASSIFTKTSDRRGQVGQMLSSLRTLYRKFEENVESVVLIMDKTDLNLLLTPVPGKIKIEADMCRNLLDFSAYGPEFAGKKLCSDFNFSKDYIPNACIFGSGCFIASNKIVTAAHVLLAAQDHGIEPENMLFIRGHYEYDLTDEIVVNTDQLYELAQPQIMNNNQIGYGEDGDWAWVKVKPFFGAGGANSANGYDGELNIPQKARKMKQGQEVYALGHGFGVAMKLSFNGQIDMMNSCWFGCDIDIFPGNSGSPVFDSETQHLVGIISGINELSITIAAGQDCVQVSINNAGNLSAISSRINNLLISIK